MAEDTFNVTKVNYGGLDAGEGEFQTAFNNLVKELEDLEQKLLQKTALWQGSTEEAFNVVRATWQSEAKGLSDIVQLLAKNINITRMNMQDVERINTAMFDGK